MVLILKMTRFSCFFRLSLPQEISEMAQTFISEIEWLAVFASYYALLIICYCSS